MQKERKEQAPALMDKVEVNSTVLWGSIILSVLLYVPMMVWQEQAQSIISGLYDGLTSGLWLWEFIFVLVFLFVMWLGFGRYGNIKLGRTEDKPEFSTFTWLGMIFAAAAGAGMVYFSFIEPIQIVSAPPFFTEPGTAEAAQYALAYGMFNWGPIAWSIFALTGIIFGYYFHVRKKPYLFPSYTCKSVLGKNADGMVGKLIDIFVIVGLVGATATTMGVVVPLLSALTARMTGLEDNLTLQVAVTVIFCLIFGYSAYKGLYSGISKVADLNTYACFALLVFVLVVGPTGFIVSNYCDSIGVLFQNFIRMSFYTDPIGQSGFPQSYTCFYWSWWATYCVFMGLFIARISKGRTVRQIAMAVTFVGAFGTSLFYGIFGGFALDKMMNQGQDLQGMLETIGGQNVVIFLLDQIPLQIVFIPIFFLVMFVFTAATLNAAAYTMAMMGCKAIRDGEEPPKWTRALWSFILMVIAIALLIVGGGNTIQLSAILTSVPILFIVLILMASLLKTMRKDFGNQIAVKEIVLQQIDPDDD